MIRVVGIDVGATYTKALVLDEDKNIIGRSMVKTGFNLAGAAERGYAEVLGSAGPPKRRSTTSPRLDTAATSSPCVTSRSLS